MRRRALPIEDIEAAGYHAVWHGQKGFNGVAILAKGKAPVLRQVGLPGDPDDTHSRYIEAEVDGLIVASIYLPNGNPIGTEKFDYKLSGWTDCGSARRPYWRRNARRPGRRLQRDSGRPRHLLAPGDGQRRAVPAGKPGRLPNHRQPGLDRCAAGPEPGRRSALYFLGLYRRGLASRRGFRIDHLLCSPQAADRLSGAEVHKWARGEEKASDHAPVAIELA